MYSITWFTSRENNGKFDFRIYMGEKQGKYWLRFVAGFQRKSDKINFEEIIVKADNKLIKIDFDDYEEKFEETLNDGLFSPLLDLEKKCVIC